MDFALFAAMLGVVVEMVVVVAPDEEAFAILKRRRHGTIECCPILPNHRMLRKLLERQLPRHSRS